MIKNGYKIFFKNQHYFARKIDDVSMLDSLFLEIKNSNCLAICDYHILDYCDFLETTFRFVFSFQNRHIYVTIDSKHFNDLKYINIKIIPFNGANYLLECNINPSKTIVDILKHYIETSQLNQKDITDFFKFDPSHQNVHNIDDLV